MKKITLALAALVAFGAAANAQDAKKLICKANFDAAAVALNQPHYLGVNDAGDLQMTNDIDGRSIWTVTKNEDGSYFVENPELEGWLYSENGANRTLNFDQSKVYIVDSPVIDGAVGFTTSATATTADNAFLNISGATGMIAGWSLDRGSSFFILDYVEGDTDESVQSRVQAKLERSRMEAYLNASSFGRLNKASFLSQLDEVTTTEELEKTVENITGIAISGFISDLEAGAKLSNVNCAGKIVSYDANAAQKFQFVTDFPANGNGLFAAEVTNGIIGFTVAPANAIIRIKNVGSGLYIAKQPDNSQPVTAVAAGSADVAEYKVVAGMNGLELQCVNSDTDNNFLNVANSTFLTVWNFANDQNGYWSVETLDQFSANEIQTAFIGETTEGEFGETLFTSINKLVIKVRKGATVSFGSAHVYTYDEQDQTVNIINKPVAELIEGVTPTEGVITYEEYDESIGEWGDYVEKTLDADIYEIALENAIVEPGDYHFDLTVGAFSAVNAEGKTVYSPEAQNADLIPAPSFEVTVAPEAGTVKELTTITIGSAEGVAANPTYADTEKLTLEKTTYTDYYDPDMDEHFPMPSEPVTVFEITEENISEYATDGSDDVFFSFPVNAASADAGDYVLTIPEGFFVNDAGVECEFTTVTWTIEDVTGIKTITNVKVNGQAIYDLQGRKLVAPVKGINIINGKKVLVK